MLKMKGFPLWITLALAMVALAACATQAPATQAGGATETASEAPSGVTTETATGGSTSKTDPNTLVLALNASPADLDPASAYDGQSVNILRNVYDPLLILDGNSVDKFKPMLAESWSVSADGKVWTMKIRTGAKFTDGTPVNAETVRASFARTMDLGLATSWIYTQFLTSSKDIVAVDATTLEFHLNAPSPIFLQALSSDYGSWVVSTAAMKANEKSGDGGHEWATTHAIGSGPYVIQDYKPEDRVVLTQNPDYWQGWSGNHVKNVTVLTIPDASTRRQMLERGDVDIASNFGVEDLEAMKNNPDLAVHEDYGTRVLQITFTFKGTLVDPKVRQAYSYAFDYDSFVNQLMKGHARKAQGPVAQTIAGHDNSLFQYPTDLGKAKQLLADAKVPEGTEYTLWYQQGDAPSRDAAQLFQAQLAQLGMKLNIVEKPVSAFFSTYYGSDPIDQRPDFFVYYWWPDYNDIADWLGVQYNSATAGNGGNGGFYKNDRVDEILNSAYSVDETQRAAMYKEVQKILTVDDPAAIWVAEMPESVVVRKNVQGYVLSPIYIGTYDFYAISKTQ